MAGDITGTLRKVTLDGVTFDVMADTNVTEVGSAWQNEAVPTSGRNLKKMTRRVEAREGVVLACNGSEREVLKDLAERTADFPMSYETAAGDVYRATGWIEFENRETEEGRATIQMHPRNGWESFLAG
jgi:hypothetical protein